MSNKGETRGRVSATDIFCCDELKATIVTYIEPSEVLNLDLVAKACAIENLYWASLLETEIFFSSGIKMRLLRRAGQEGVDRPDPGEEREEEERLTKADDKFLYWALKGAIREKFVGRKNLVPDYFIAEDCSSVDRSTEGPSNVNCQSQCFNALKNYGWLGKEVPDSIEVDTITPMGRVQLRCGCAISQACYWCSKASNTNDAEEWIDFHMVNRSDKGERVRRRLRSLTLATPIAECQFDVAIIHSFTVTAYRSYLQPHGPIFAPRRVAMSIWHGLKDDTGSKPPGIGTKCYESPEFEVRVTEEEQQFTLPKPLVLPLSPSALDECNYTVRLRVIGAHQRQTLDEATGGEHADWFYVCISHVTIDGITLQTATPTNALANANANAFMTLASADCSTEAGAGRDQTLVLTMDPHSQYDDSRQLQSLPLQNPSQGTNNSGLSHSEGDTLYY